jgi:hypothetical protein
VYVKVPCPVTVAVDWQVPVGLTLKQVLVLSKVAPVAADAVIGIDTGRFNVVVPVKAGAVGTATKFTVTALVSAVTTLFVPRLSVTR